jgi:hypothetical protein
MGLFPVSYWERLKTWNPTPLTAIRRAACVAHTSPEAALEVASQAERQNGLLIEVPSPLTCAFADISARRYDRAESI